MAESISSQALVRNGIKAFNRILAWWLSELREAAGSLFHFAQKTVLEFVVDGDAKRPRVDVLPLNNVMQ